MTFRAVVIEDNDGFDNLRDQWHRLLLANQSATPFHSWVRCRAYWQHLAPPRSQLQLFIVRDGRGDLCGVAPMFIRPGSMFRASVKETKRTLKADGSAVFTAYNFSPLWRFLAQIFGVA